jgi:hypothetical protein
MLKKKSSHCHTNDFSLGAEMFIAKSVWNWYQPVSQNLPAGRNSHEKRHQVLRIARQAFSFNTVFEDDWQHKSAI